MIGSLTITDYEVYCSAEELILEAIHGLGHAYSSVVAFNDDPCRTKEQVLEVYDTAIAVSMQVTQRYWQDSELLAA